MDQQQFKVAAPLGTKLLFGLVTLFIVVIGFLNFSTILLLTEDKRAYTYQSQSTEAVLAGKELTNRARQAIDTMRIYLSGIDPQKHVSHQQKDRLQTVIDNQSDILLGGILLVNPELGSTTLAVQTTKSSLKMDQGEIPNLSAITPAMIKECLPQLLKDGFYFFNLSKLGYDPILAIAFADLKFKDNPTGMPVAIAITVLNDLAKEIKSSGLTIANRQGWVIFSTDPGPMYTTSKVSDNPLFQASLVGQVSAATREYEAQGIRYLGGYNRTDFGLVTVTRTEWKKAMKAAYAMMEQFILLGLMAISVAIIFALLFSKSITAPLNTLYDATKEISLGNFDVKLDSQSRDEVGALTRSFSSMCRKIQDLILENVRKAHLENEVAIASTVQQTLFPPASHSNPGKIELFSLYKAAAECGGDWYGYFTIGNKMCLMIADATGHGLPSALITASARSCFSVLNKLAAEETFFRLSPSDMLAYANRVVFEAATGKIMMTFFVGVIDFDARTLTYASAGHNPPWLFKLEEGKYQLKSLVASGTRLGEAADTEKYTEKTVPLDANDVLFLYTDGLMEGKNTTGDQYGKKKTREVVTSNLNQEPNQQIELLMQSFMEHNGEKALDDDVTLAMMRLFPTQIEAAQT